MRQPGFKVMPLVASQNAGRIYSPPVDGLVALGITITVMHWFQHGTFYLKDFKASFTLSQCAAALVFVFLWQYVFSVLRLYDKSAAISSRFFAVFKGVALMTLGAMAYTSRFHHGLLALRAGAATFVALYCYAIARTALSSFFLERMGARDPRRVIIVGSGRRASKAWRAIRTRYHSSIKLLGFVDDRGRNEMPPELATMYLGTLDELSGVLLNEVVDLLLVAMPIQSCYPLMQRAITIAESAGVQVMYLDDIYSTRRKKRDLNQTIFRDLAPEQDNYLLFIAAKRIFDVLAAGLLGLVLMPVLLVIAVVVKMTSDGPVLYRQERYGFRRRRFKMVKFRSMVNNAESLLPTLEHANEASGPIFKMRNDPRITRIGRFLRSTSLDELPQLWNVLVGDMSLVGPRPMSVRDVSLFDEAALMRRFSVKPGITGLWQVSGRSHVGFDQWVIMDNRYIDSQSLSLDIKILARTVGTVLRRSGSV